MPSGRPPQSAYRIGNGGPVGIAWHLNVRPRRPRASSLHGLPVSGPPRQRHLAALLFLLAALGAAETSHLLHSGEECCAREAEAGRSAFADGDRPRGFHVKRATDAGQHAVPVHWQSAERTDRTVGEDAPAVAALVSPPPTPTSAIGVPAEWPVLRGDRPRNEERAACGTVLQARRRLLLGHDRRTDTQPVGHHLVWRAFPCDDFPGRAALGRPDGALRTTQRSRRTAGACCGVARRVSRETASERCS